VQEAKAGGATDVPDPTAPNDVGRQESGAAAGAGPGSGSALRRRKPLAPGDLAGLAITAGDFEAAVGRVQPSVRREGFATTPDVTWADVGSLDEARCPISCWALGGSASLGLMSARTYKESIWVETVCMPSPHNLQHLICLLTITVLELVEP